MVRGKITDNLAQLARERTLIRTGQKQLVNMTDGIKQQLGEEVTRDCPCNNKVLCVQRRPAHCYLIKRRIVVKDSQR